MSGGTGVRERRPRFSQCSAEKKNCPENFDKVSWQQVSIRHFPSGKLTLSAAGKCQVASAETIKGTAGSLKEKEVSNLR